MAVQSVADRFWSKVDKSGGPDACWMWKCGKNKKGYGSFWADGEMWTSHRFSFYLANGAVPAGMCVCHACDVRSCVNPSHLWIGTNADNTRDRDIKGRQVSPKGDAHWARRNPEMIVRGDRHYSKLHPEKVRRGTNSGNARLTDDDIRSIRERYQGGESQSSIAETFGMSQVNISHVVLGRTWSHVIG